MILFYLSKLKVKKLAIKELNCNKHKDALITLKNEINTSPYSEKKVFFEQIDKFSKFLPEEIKKNLNEFKTNNNINSNILLFKSLPLEPNLDSIATSNIKVNKETYVSEICLALFSSIIGEVIGYKQIDDRALFHDIIPGKDFKKSNLLQAHQ